MEKELKESSEAICYDYLFEFLTHLKSVTECYIQHSDTSRVKTASSIQKMSLVIVAFNIRILCCWSTSYSTENWSLPSEYSCLIFLFLKVPSLARKHDNDLVSMMESLGPSPLSHLMQ